MSLPSSSRNKSKSVTMIPLPPGVEQAELEIMEKFMEELTTTGKEVLDVKRLKPLFERAGISKGHLDLFLVLLFRQMEMEHAQVRYSSLLILNELVNRSEHFRKEIFFCNEKDLLLRFVRLIIQGSTKVPKKGKAKKLRPQFVAVKLKAKGLEFIQQWIGNYGDSRDCDFSQTIGSIFQKLGMDLPISSVADTRSSSISTISPGIALDILKREFETNEEEISRTLAEIKSCFSLLVPKFDTPTNLDSSEESSDENSMDDENYSSPAISSSVPVFIAPNGLIKLKRNEDNEAILDNLIGLYKLTANRYIPLIDSWLKSTDLENAPGLEERMEELKSKLDFEKSRYERLHIKFKDDSDSTDCDSEDSEFEEVGSQPEWMSIPCLAKPENNDNTSLPLGPDCASTISKRKREDASDLISSQESCRVPLEGGKLCPRRDLLKCPFHGKIIRRDEAGKPIDPDEIDLETERQLEADEKKQPDWQDPTFLKELKAKIGIDLTIKKSRKGKQTFEERYPGLISLRISEGEASRKRLFGKLAKLRGRKRRKISAGGNQLGVDAEAPVLPYV